MAMADGRKRRNELYIYITNNKKEERDSKNHFKVVRINESKEKREREGGTKGHEDHGDYER